MPTTRHRRLRVHAQEDDLLEGFLTTGEHCPDIEWTLFSPDEVFKAYDMMKERIGADIKRTKGFKVLEKGTERFDNYSWISHDAYMSYKKTGYKGD